MRWSFAKVEQWVWYLFLGIAAWQTRIILWQADRIFSEWRAAFLYASDVLMLVLFVYAARQLIRIRLSRSDGVLVAFVAVAGISLFRSSQMTVSAYQWVRLVQFVVFFLYVRYYVSKKFSADASALAFVIGVLGQSTIAIGQYVLQHELGLRWLGETLLNTRMAGVAVFFDAAHVKILRAYGTLPHPNVLAVYLLAGLWALAYLYLRHASGELRHHRWVWAAAGSVMLWALYFTFSRTMIVVGLGATLVFAGALFLNRFSGSWANISAIRARVRHMLIVGIIATSLFAGIFWRQVSARASLSGQEEAVRLRVYYAQQAVGSGWHQFLHLNWLGVGIGNFTGWLKKMDPYEPLWLYQPAHNLYLLVYTETGILGAVLFVAWLGMIMKSAITHAARPAVVRWGLVMILGAWLIIALFDHFFWTLQQGRILWWLTLALAA